MDLNKLAREITLREGKKISVSNAQVKEVLKIALEELAMMDCVDVLLLLRRYR